MAVRPFPESLDAGALARLRRERLCALDKSLPSGAADRTVEELLASQPRLSGFSTPLLVLSDAGMEHNLRVMADWCASRGVDLAPHGKTTMAPQLWDRQLRAGSWGITVATGFQLKVAVEFGVRRVLLANALVDPGYLAWTSTALDDDPDLQVLVWADSVDTVAVMDAVLGPLHPRRPLDVLVELGAAGGRTGARDVHTATTVAAAVAASPNLRLAGVSGYEGALAHDASEAGLAAVRGYLEQMRALHETLGERGLYDGDEVYVTAGGSAYFDDVVDVLGGTAHQGTRMLLRSGAYMIHDDGFYRGISPFSRGAGKPFRSAMHAWARVVSRPEPGLVLLDCGKRDVPFDEGLPEPQLVADQLGAPSTPLTGARVTAVNDQHAFLAIEPRGSAGAIRVGQVVRLGLSHPCTAFDKWRLIPVVEGYDGDDDPVVTDLVRTFF
ncbi:MAG: amino acid deaminase [Actinomycetes bacterium]